MAAGQIDIIVAKKALAEIDSATEKIAKLNDGVIELAKNLLKLQGDLSAATTPKGIEDRLKKNADAQLKIKGSVDKVIEAETKLRIIREKGFDKFEKDISKQTKLRETQVNKEAALRDRLLKQQKKEVIQLEKARVAAIKYNSAYANLNRNYEKAKINLANLLAAETKNTRAIKIAQKEFDRLTTKVRKVDAATRNYTKNIGNYGSALKGSIGFVKQMVSAMGLMGGAFLAIQIIRNTVRRIRDFDKSLVGLSAILRINRKDLRDLEATIIKVAGSSIKTSNEVADLATKLATLGKSKDEIINLLEPVNNLSIGLQATSEEAGELLIQTLNAFGKSSKEASKFADIIAKMRTSTALDFERIKDALGFLSPTARAAGVSFEKTGAILGTLVDNGIKAARAGRLMSTAFLRLAKDGKTLEDALDEINEAQENNVTNLGLLRIAGDLFGARAAALGLILADNRDKVADLTGEFENARGTLDKLTKDQLKSLTAETRILDSTWEKFILTIENGEGFFGELARSVIRFTSSVIKSITPQRKLSEIIEEERIELRKLELKINDANTSQEDRIKLIDDLQMRYPKLLANIDSETINNAELSKAIKLVNDQLINKIILQKEDEKIEKQNEKIANKRLDLIRQEDKVQEQVIKLAEKFGLTIKNNGTLEEKTRDLIRQRREQQRQTGGRLIDSATELSFQLNELLLTQKNLNIVENEGNALLDAKNELLKRLGITTDDVNDSTEEVNTSTEETVKTTTELNEIIEGSIGALNQIIAINNKLISQATDRTTIAKLQEENRLLEQQKKLLLEGVRPVVSAIQTVAAGPGGGVDTSLASTDLEQDKVSASTFDLALDEVNTFVDTYGEQIDQAIDITNAFFDNRLERIQQDIDANNEFFANQIALAEGNEAEQVRLEKERQKRDAELKRKQSEEARKQFVIKQGVALATIAINTAVAISEASPNVFKIIAAAVLGAIQLATVASTPVPKFKEGTKVPTVKDMLAITGDGGKNEPITKDGKLIGVSPDTPTLTYLPKGSEVHKDLDSFMMSKNYDLEAINNAAVMTSIFNDGEKLSSVQLTDSFSKALEKFNSKIEAKIERGIKRGFRGIKINNNIGDDIEFLKYKQETL